MSQTQDTIVTALMDVESKRMLLRIEQGKGRRDRFAMLSERLLELLRDWYRIARPPVWLFPGRDPLLPVTTRQLNRAFHAAATMAGIKKRVKPHTLRPVQAAADSVWKEVITDPFRPGRPCHS